MHPAIEQRNRILKEQNLSLVHVFDTNQHEPDKDVVLATDPGGMEVILRVGEVRPEGVFEKGYDGEHIVVPVRLAHSADPAWEIETYLDGSELVDLMRTMDTALQLEGSPSREIMEEKMVHGFWEMQTAWAESDLPPKEQKAIEHAKGALNLLSMRQKMQVLNIAKANEDFLCGQFPSKWKYSKDNVLWIKTDGRIGLVDLAGVGLRHWGYDIGWIYWPEWYEMSIAEWRDVAGYVQRLEKLFSTVVDSKPKEVPLKAAAIQKMLWLGLITRIVGGYFDIAERVSHAQAVADAEYRRRAFLTFLDGLLEQAMVRVDG